MNQPEISAGQEQCSEITSYGHIWDGFTEPEVSNIVQLKRFFEWISGDTEFAAAVEKGDFSKEMVTRLGRIGIRFNLEEVALLWKEPDILTEAMKSGTNACLADISHGVKRKIASYPLIDLWIRFNRIRETLYRSCSSHILQVPQNKKFNEWRLRRVAAVKSELGFYGHHIDHPILAFELGNGCSVGCWFCAFATRKLTQNFDYRENRDFFRQIAQTCVDEFGKDQTSLALLYYGTEPHDNPHYIDFVKDYTGVTGSPVCTSTAVTTDAVWIRDLITFYRQFPQPWPRLSVLSKASMFKIHELFTPDELRDVGLLMQMKDNLRPKVNGGRILKEEAGMRNRKPGQYLKAIIPQGSIACVSGFLINMVNRTIQLVSPCHTCEKWPFGYRVFAQTTFTDILSFKKALEDLIDDHMPLAPKGSHLAKFRDDLVYTPTEEGFDLVSPNQIHHLQGKAVFKPLGKLIAAQEFTYNELYDAMVDQYKQNPMVVASVVKKLFDNGFLNEVF